MYSCRSYILSAILCLFLLCGAVQATNLQITVLDSLDNVTIPHAKVFVNGAQYAMTNNNGQALVVHNGLDNQLIRVSMAGYDDWQNTVLHNDTSLFVNLSRKALTLKISLYDSDTLGPVAGADVNISAMNATQHKQSDASGAVLFGVNASVLYSVDITAPNYEPRSGTVDVGVEDKEVQFWLLSGNKYSFVVKDKDSKVPLQGAEVRLNDVLAGKTDERGILSVPVTRGRTYSIEIQKEGYDTVSESRSIRESDAMHTTELQKSPLGAFVYVYDESHDPLNGADIYINGSLSGTTNQYGRSTFPNLVAGSYPVEVRKAGYISSSQTLVVSNKSEDYTFTLALENAALTVYVQDKDLKIIPNASVALDGVVTGMTDDHGQFATRVKYNQIYNISVSKDGYQPASVMKQVVQGNATDSVNINLEKTMDLGFIGIIVIIVIVVLILFAVFRMYGRRPGHHIMRKNEI